MTQRKLDKRWLNCGRLRCLQRSSHGKPVLQNSKKKRASFLKLYGQFSILVIMADEMCFKDFFKFLLTGTIRHKFCGGGGFFRGPKYFLGEFIWFSRERIGDRSLFYRV